MIARFMFIENLPASFSGNYLQHVGYRHQRRSLSHSPRSTSNQASSSLPGQHNEPPVSVPKIPLCERPPAHSTQLTSLLAWRERAAQRATLAGTKWAATGEADAPSVEDLHTELSWLLDDAVAGVVDSSSAAWQQKTWREVERAEAGSAAVVGAAEIYLRESLEELDTLWHRRVEDRVPLQYLTSCAFWRDLTLSVDPGVLIPRPETELLIDFAVAAVQANPALGHGQWADLGTGSGALAIGLAHTIPTLSKVWAVDLAPEPAAHAAFNAERAGLHKESRPMFEVVQGSWYEPLVTRGGCLGQLSGIVSNPPYITEDLMQGLQAEVGQYEPELALDGGEGLGIDALAPLCRGAVEMLQSGGFLALETAGGEQAEYIAQLLQHLRCGIVVNGAVVLSSSSGGSSAGEEGESNIGGEEHLAFENVTIRNDLRGVDRFVTATRSNHPCTYL